MYCTGAGSQNLKTMIKALLRQIKLSIVILLTIAAQSAKGSHTMGADLTYTCLGGNQYRVTLSFYRDCIGVAAPTNPLVTISSASCGQSFGVICYPRAGTGQEVTPTCSSATTTCNGGSFTGIQEWVYDGIVNIPIACTDWTFSYSICCRNAAITTINNPGASTFWIYATLNNTIPGCNSSPSFSNKPVPFLCMGQQYCFNHGAYDADGDSIVYELITPRQTASTIVDYLPGYDAANPLVSSPATQFSTATGDICFTPQQIEVTVMAVLVKEYRNGVLIGTVERDIQLTVMNCANNLPALSGINGTNNFDLTVCAGSPFCFDIFSSDPDPGQQLTVTWDNGITAGTFTSDTALNPISTFCWTPTAADISTTPYVFTVRVADDACPYVGSQVFSYTITVTGLSVNAGPDQNIACSDLATLTALASGGSPPYTYLWSNGSTMQSITVGAGTYIVAVNDGTCTMRDTVQVFTPYFPTASFNYSPSTCLNEPVQFNNTSTTPGGIIISTIWDFGDGTGSTIQNPIHQFPGIGSYDVMLIVETSLGCIDTIIQQINIAPPPTVNFTYAITCVGDQIQFTDQSTPPADVNFWVWSFGDGDSALIQNPTHVYDSSGTHYVTLIAGDSASCADTVTLPVIIYPLPVPAFSTTDACLGSSINLNGIVSPGDTINSWTWIIDDSTIYNGNFPSHLFDTAGIHTITLIATNNHNCPDTLTQTVTIHPLPNVNLGNDITICQNDSIVLIAQGGGSYNWSNGATNDTLIITPSGNSTYSVTVTDSNGCSAIDAVNISVNIPPVAVAGNDQHICEGSSATLTASGGTNYTWVPLGSNSSSVVVTPDSNSTYIVNINDGNGCTDSDTVEVFVHQQPVVNLSPIFICSGSSSTLNAGAGFSNYLWNTGDTSQSITIDSGGVYSVTVTDSYGCSNSASANVTVGTSLTLTLTDVSFCSGDSAILDAGFPGNTYLWSNGATTQTITVSSTGSYGVTVTDPAGCSGSINVNALVNPLPIANFTAQTVCEGINTLLIDQSSIGGGSITNWLWDFGGGNTSIQQNPSYNFGGAGNYPVSLTVASNNGCTASYSQNIAVSPLPIANFTALNACQIATVPITNLSTVSSGNITSYDWNFGNGNTSSVASPSVTYPNEGTFTISLIVTTAAGCSDTVSNPINIYPKPNLTAGSSTVCLGNGTMFNASASISSGSINSYSWNFGDGNTSTGNNPVHTYAGSGNYLASVIVTSNQNCSDTSLVNVIVNSLPIAQAGNDTTICNSSAATLTASGGTVYQWMPGNINSMSIVVNPVINTIYTVTVTDSNGCSNTDQANVFINSLPTIVATADDTICHGNSITLTASGGSSYLWSNGSNNSSITVNPTSNATFTVTATDINGCSAVDTVQITVHSLPNVNAMPNIGICEGSSIEITATGAVNYTWSNGSNSNSIIVSPTNNNWYYVTGSDVNGCIATDSTYITVNPVPSVNIPPTFLCSGSSIMLDAGNSGSTFFWSTGETSQTILVTDSGNYTVTVTSANGCAALGNATVTVGGNLIVNPMNTAICDGQSVLLDAGNPGSTYLWNNGATTQTINVSANGNYIVQITDANGCTGSVLSTVSVNPIPVANFIANGVCLGDLMNFTDQSAISTGSINNYNWDFGNGFSANTANAQFNYGSSGAFDVTLTVTSAAGCSDAITQQVEVNPLPVAAFSAAPVCLGNATNFNNNSSNNTVSVNWNFGNNTSSAIANPSVIYATPGDYNVILIAQSNAGCLDTIDQMVTVYGLPNAAFTTANACEGSSIILNNNSTSNNGAITSYLWDFGNGATSTQSNPSTVYGTYGNYEINLTVISSLGCADTAHQQVTIHPLPISAFLSSNACAQSNLAFQNTSSIPSGSITSSLWLFGDNTNSALTNPSHIYTNAGNYIANLISTSNFGCVDTFAAPVSINPLPVAGFIAPDVCAGNSINFTDTSSITSGSIQTWTWNFGNGNTSNASNPIFNYSSPGTYNVSLQVITSNGCIANFSNTVNIYPIPVASFNATNVCFNNATQFINQSAVPGGGNFSTIWQFGDNASDSTFSPQHTYLNTGNYPVTMIITTPFGCQSSITNSVAVYNGPNANFSTANGCLGTQTNFNDLSSTQDGQIVNWLWNLGDGTTTTSPSPIHTYNAPGTYQVSLTTTTNYGCYDQASGMVEVFPIPAPQAIGANACVNTPIQFTDGSTNNIGLLNYSWTFGDGTQSTLISPEHSFAYPGIYQVSLATTSSNGCVVSDSVSIEVFAAPNAQFTATNACENIAIQFNNNSMINSGSISSYYWSLGNGSTSTIVNPSNTYTTPGSYTVSLTATSNNGCIATSSLPITIFPNPTVNFGSSIAGCSPLYASFTDSSSIPSGQIQGWLWDFGNGDVSTNQNPNYTYDTPGNFTISLTVVSDQGCQQSLQVPAYVTVFAQPVADFTASTNVIDIVNPVISFTNVSSNYTSWIWNFGDGSSINNILNPTHVFGDTGTYATQLIVSNAFGCIDTIIKTFRIEPRSTLFVPNCFTPNLDGTNDVFKPEFTQMENIKVWIFDRWGVELTKWEGLTGFWDGTYQERPVQEDVYVYLIKGWGIDGKVYDWTGSVSVVR